MLPVWLWSLATLCSQVDFKPFLSVFPHRLHMGFLMAQALIGYATFISFELLLSFGLDGDVLRDVHWFWFYRSPRLYMKNPPVYIWLYRASNLPGKSRLFLQLWETH